jgi:hypothetical protein
MRSVLMAAEYIAAAIRSRLTSGPQLDFLARSSAPCGALLEETLMRIRRTSIALAVAAAVAGFVAYNHVRPAEAASQWASLVMGKNASGTIVGELSTDKAADEQARVQAINGFIRQGGVNAISSRSWNCKGYIAAALASNSNYDVTWCKPDATTAANAALAGCKAAGGLDCKVVFDKLDR